jgi:uroporphyrinogen-III synthase
LSIKTILVSQPKPASENSPYLDLANKYNLNIDFRPFIQVEGASAKEVRKQRVNFEEFTGVIFTSKVSADHFFRIAEEIRYEIPDTLKYFCISEAIALYLQKYVFQKRFSVFCRQHISVGIKQ